jgi:hypothetical protein
LLRAPLTDRIADARGLDLDYLSAEVGMHRRREASADIVAEFKDTNAIERQIFA